MSRTFLLYLFLDISEKCRGIGFPPCPAPSRSVAKTKIFLGWGYFFQFKSYIFLAFYIDLQLVTTKQFII